MTRRAALVAALSALFWVGLFCDPVQFWLAGVGAA